MSKAAHGTVGIGLALLGLGVVGLIASHSKANTQSYRDVIVEGRDYRVRRLGSGRYRVEMWGPDGLLASYELGQTGPLGAEGDPELIKILEQDMYRFPPDLFEPAVPKPVPGTAADLDVIVPPPADSPVPYAILH